MSCRYLLAIACAAFLSGCGQQPPGHYKITVHDAFQRLAKANFAEFKSNRQCGILIHVESDNFPEKWVRWRITSSGREMFNFIAHLTPIDASHTKVDIELSKEENGREAYDGSQFYRRPAVKQPVRPAIFEQIDAILTERPFDWQRVREGHSNGQTFSSVSRDSVCDVQRGRLEENGEPFSIDDDTQQSTSE